MAWKFKQPGSENWWVGYRVNGRQFRESVGSPDEAKADEQLQLMRTMHEAHKAGKLTEKFYRFLTGMEGSADTLRASVDSWLKECKDLSPRTIKGYRDGLDEFCDYVKASDQGPLLRDIQKQAIAAFLREKRAATSTATANLARKILVGFFNYAVDNDMISASPVPSSRALKFDKDSERVRRAFTLAELKTVFKKAPNQFWKYMVLTGFYCGQRMGDLITMTWGAVDFEQGIISMTQRKTGKTLEIPLRSELAVFLTKLKPAKVKPSAPIWPSESDRYEQFGPGVFSSEFYDEVLLPAGLVVKRSQPPRRIRTETGS